MGLTKIAVGCLFGIRDKWYFPDETKVSEIIDACIDHFKFRENGKYELWLEIRGNQVALDPETKLKDLRFKDNEMFHFIDLSFIRNSKTLNKHEDDNKDSTKEL